MSRSQLSGKKAVLASMGFYQFSGFQSVTNSVCRSSRSHDPFFIPIFPSFASVEKSLRVLPITLSCLLGFFTGISMLPFQILSRVAGSTFVSSSGSGFIPETKVGERFFKSADATPFHASSVGKYTAYGGPAQGSFGGF